MLGFNRPFCSGINARQRNAMLDPRDPDYDDSFDEESGMLTVEQINDYEHDELDDMGDALVLQTAINARQWALQGHYGRTMMAAIQDGRCMLGRSATTDYYGNIIPGRFDVKPGAPGSAEYVIERMGSEWAEQIEGVA